MVVVALLEFSGLAMLALDLGLRFRQATTELAELDLQHGDLCLACGPRVEGDHRRREFVHNLCRLVHAVVLEKAPNHVTSPFVENHVAVRQVTKIWRAYRMRTGADKRADCESRHKPWARIPADGKRSILVDLHV